MDDENRTPNDVGENMQTREPVTEQPSEQTSAQSEQTPQQATYTPSHQTDFLRETIKQKPMNKRRLLRRTVTTVVLAAVFGLVACLVFLLLEPVISNRLYPEEETEDLVSFSEETIEDEMNPEDMLTDEDMLEDALAEGNVSAELEDAQIQSLLSQVTFGLTEYQDLYKQMGDLAKEVSRSLVTVTGVTPNVDLFFNNYENESTASGVIVADNGQAMLILVSMGSLHSAESLEVTFYDGNSAPATVLQSDTTTNLAILSVPKASMDASTKKVITTATLGSSNPISLLGTPVMALGSPTGTSGSICYGTVTSTGTTIDLVDSDYKLITTDIYGSADATGVLVTMRGAVVGIIDNSFNESGMENLLSAYGISELKKTITKLSNKQERAYLGIHGADVPEEANVESGVPYGAYIRSIEMDSPALSAGIQSGDVIVGIGNIPIETYDDLLNVLYDVSPGDTLSVTLMRRGVDGYRELSAEVTLGAQ